MSRKKENAKMHDPIEESGRILASRLDDIREAALLMGAKAKQEMNALAEESELEVVERNGTAVTFGYAKNNRNKPANFSV